MPYINVRRWGGSLVTALDEEQIQPGDFSVLENFIYDENGFPTVRGGRRKWHTTKIWESPVTYTIRGLYNYHNAWIQHSGQERLICYSGHKIYKSEMDRQWDEIYDGLELGLRPSFATLRGMLIIAFNSQSQQKPISWMGRASSMSTIKAAPAGYIVTAHAGRLWIASSEFPSRVYYSAPFEPQNWNISDGSGWISVNPGDGNSISALVPGFAGEMIIFKDGAGGGATYRMIGLSESEGFRVVPLSHSVGALHHQLVSTIGDRDIMFASRRGIHSLSRVAEHGDLRSSYVDIDVSNRWRKMTDRQKSASIAIDDYPHDTWWLFTDLDGDGVNDHGWLFNYRRVSSRGTPSVSDVTFGASAAVVSRMPGGGRDELMTGGDDGYVYTEHNPEATDEGTAFEWKATVAPIDAGDAFSVKSWQDLWLSFDNWGVGEASIEWRGDNKAPTTETLNLNPANMPSPRYGVRLGEFRGAPTSHRAADLFHLREGGRSVEFSIYGSSGRIRLRAFRLGYSVGRQDVTADLWSPQVRANQ